MNFDSCCFRFQSQMKLRFNFMVKTGQSNLSKLEIWYDTAIAKKRNEETWTHSFSNASTFQAAHPVFFSLIKEEQMPKISLRFFSKLLIFILLWVCALNVGESANKVQLNRSRQNLIAYIHIVDVHTIAQAKARV